jgi:hypothetical protein
MMETLPGKTVRDLSTFRDRETAERRIKERVKKNSG